ncbi:MAG: hypothetical protein JO145_03065 [Acidobacteriaceae bacterium]|nr:hypothetical protein [Acidobacteriaceae bacterium]
MKTQAVQLANLLIQQPIDCFARSRKDYPHAALQDFEPVLVVGRVIGFGSVSS